MKSALYAFRKEWLASNVFRNGFDQFSTFDARQLRYDLWWALFENNAYDSGIGSPHKWSNQLKSKMGLYSGTQGILNPCYRLGEFWSSAIMGGRLDPLAGDGSTVPSAIPIITKDEALRPVISRLWKDSKWQTSKGIWTRKGSVLGDAPLKVWTDADSGRVMISPIHPRTVRDVEIDCQGDVTSYVLEESRIDPAYKNLPFYSRGNERITCVYHETCERIDDGKVLFRTYRNREPYAWNPDVGPEWEEAWPFVPLVMVQHLNFGHPFCGMSEFQGAFAKVIGRDDFASKVNDSVRKAVEAIWFFSGMKQADLNLALSRPKQTLDNPENDRQQLATLATTNDSAKAMPLVAPVDITGATPYIQLLLDDQLQDYPELRYDRIRATGDASGAALREARKPAELKVHERRTGYDEGFMKAMCMAIAIGGEQRFPGYEGFGIEDYAPGNLEFGIDARSVFDLDPLDRIEEETAQSAAVQGWVNVGVPLEMALIRSGWTPEDAKAAADAKAKADKDKAAADAAALKASVDAKRADAGLNAGAGNSEGPAAG